MKLHFLQDNSGIKQGESISILEARQRIAWAGHFNDEQLKAALISTKVVETIEDEPELRTATVKAPRKARVTR